MSKKPPGSSKGSPSYLQTSEYTFRPIGTISSPFKEKFGTPRQPGLVQDSCGSLTLREDLNADALMGLAEYSHVWIVFVFHANDSFQTGKAFTKTKVHPPRLDGEAVGVFATRSPHRPSSIGLSLVEIDRIEGRTLHVKGLDLIDGTPVLDIKPYLPSIESPEGAFEGWSARAASQRLNTEWSESARDELKVLFPSDASNPTATANARASIEKILSMDPRPVVYRGTVENPNPYMNQYGFRFGDRNVVFEITPSKQEAESPLLTARIIKIEAWPPSQRD